MAEPIQIVISKSQGTAYDTQSATPVKASSGKTGTSATQKAVNVALINAGKQLASAGINQYGNLTGNTIANRQLNEATRIAGYVGEIAVGGWVGVISVGVQIGMQTLENYANVRRSNAQAEMLYARSGNVTIDGGRGTNG